jgi:hypothetical protein
MSPGYTDNYVFEFHRGNVTMKHLYCNDDIEGTTISLLPRGSNPDAIGREMWSELSGGTRKDITITDICLPIHPNQHLTATKIRSLANKYSTIPEEYRHYYPTPNEDDGEETRNDSVAAVENGPVDEENETNGGRVSLAEATKKKRKKRNNGEVQTPGVRKSRGRPKNVVVVDSSQRSIMSMFGSQS